MDKSKPTSDGLEKVIVHSFMTICLILGIFGHFFLMGVKNTNYKCIDVRIFAVNIILICFGIPLWKNLEITGQYWTDFLIYLSGVTFIVFTINGIGPGLILRRMQKNLNYAGLKNIQGKIPKVIKVIEIDEFRKKILVYSKGIGPDKFESKRNDLESAFQEKIEDIKFTNARKFVEIHLCLRELPSMVLYSDVADKNQKKCSFMLGESLSNGFMSQDITSLPHLLIGGTTGGGKSIFFKSTLINLLKTTPHLQMYLIDLKKGVEVKEFADLPNVKVAKDEPEALKVLQAIKDEMERRYEYLEKSGKRKFIEPKADKRDLIILGIDEASVLYGKTSTSKTRKEMVHKARELTDDLAKLARAAGIHLIIATQKPIKDSIDTKTLENLPGRISFKMSTHAGSNSMLGNAKAYALPDIKGRAIWKGGNKFIEIQTPYISDEEIEHEINELNIQHENGEIKNFQPLLCLNEIKDEDQDKLDELTDEKN